jgi:hypothetical protein
MKELLVEWQFIQRENEELSISLSEASKLIEEYADRQENTANK